MLYLWELNLKVIPVKYERELTHRVTKKLRRMRKLLETKQESHQRNKHLVCKTLAAIFEMDKVGTQINGPQRTRKQMTMHKVLHPRVDIDKTLYISRNEGGERLVNIEDSVDASVQGLEDYIKRAVRNSTDIIMIIRTTRK